MTPPWLSTIHLAMASPRPEPLSLIHISASTEFYNAETGMYELKGEGVEYTSAQMVDYWEKLGDTYPIISIEDGMAEEDWDGWVELTRRIGNKAVSYTHLQY